MHISGISIQSGRGGSSVSISGSVCGSITVDGNTTVINGSAGDDARVLLKVPRGTGIRLDGNVADTEIGDVDGDLTLNVHGNGDIRSGRMRRTSIAIHGNSNVRISEVNGSLVALLIGSGDVKVKTGKVTNLNVQITGTGDFKFGGVADTAVLSSTGTGDIKVAKVNSQPIKRCTGTGDIRVG